jgi:hypothetical protein
MEKISRLPANRVAEVEDFVDFIAKRDIDRQLARAATSASEPAFAKVWANPEDDVYDRASCSHGASRFFTVAASCPLFVGLVYAARQSRRYRRSSS